MANLHLVTGYAGKEHITSNDQGSFNAALMGTGEFILERGKQFAAQVISNNNVRIFDGDMLMQGRHIRLKEDTYVDLFFENGKQGYKRSDLIAVRYEKDPATEIESASLVVIKGVPTEDAYVSPEKVTGDIITENALQNDTVLYKVNFDGLAIQEPEKMFSTVPTLETMKKDTIEQLQKEAEKVIQDMTYAVDELTPLFGAEDPTPETHGRLKQFYANTETGQLFICVEAGETYTWVKIGGGGFGSHLGNVQDLILEENADNLTLKWKDPDDLVFNGEMIAEWAGTKVVRKEGSSPESVEDGILITDNTVRNQYSVDGLHDTDVKDDVQYNYALFPYTTKNVYTMSDANRVDGMISKEWRNTYNGTYSFIQDGNVWTSSNKGKSSSTAESRWAITFVGLARQNIKWQVSSEESCDRFYLTLNFLNTEQKIADAVSGIKSGEVNLEFEPGVEYELIARYTKDSSSDRNSDIAKVTFGEIFQEKFVEGISTFLEHNTWEQIAQASDLGIAKDLWRTGDKKDNYKILAFDHNDLVGGEKAGITFMTDNITLYPGVYNSTRERVLYEDSTAYKNLQTIYDGLPEELKRNIKETSILVQTSTGDGSTVRAIPAKIFLLSHQETWGSPDGNEGKDGVKYENFGRVAGSEYGWLRTLGYRHTADVYLKGFGWVYHSGGGDLQYVDTTGYYYRWAFCI